MGTKILVISHTYCEWNSRAKWRALVDLFDDVTVKIVTPYQWPDKLSVVESAPEQIIKDTVERYTVAPTKAYFVGHEIYHFYPGLFRIIRRFNPDVIQVETGSNSLALFQALLAKKLFRLKAKIVFFSWLNWVPSYGWKYRYFFSWIERYNIAYCDGAVLGNCVAQQLFTHHKRLTAQTTVVPQLATDPAIFFPPHAKGMIKRLFKLPQHSVVIGFAGRVVHEKGLHLLLSALSNMRSKLPAEIYTNIRLLIAGTGPELLAAQQFCAQHSLKEQVVFLGSLEHKEMPQFFKALDIFVLPSLDVPTWKEQFGQVLVQAMLSQVAVVGSDGGEIPQVIADAGLIFKQNNVDDLSQCLELLLGNEQLRISMAKKGYERALLEYSPPAIAKKSYEFWRQLK